MLRFFAVISLIFFLFSCATDAPVSTDETAELPVFNNYFENALTALARADAPVNITIKIKENLKNDFNFIKELDAVLKGNPVFFLLVDKEHPLDINYAPDDLVLLGKGSYVLNRDNQYLQKDAAASLEEMSFAARNAGFTLSVSSAYRSYNYQSEVYARNVTQMGRQAADRVSARPGYSQHQLGLVVDFGSVTNAFASTGEGRWIAANASRFGWSLSYPQGMENITGYSWESWHFRYVGKELTVFIDKYFNGIQQYALKFIHEYLKLQP